MFAILTTHVHILPQPNSTQPRVGLALFSYADHNHKPQTTNQTEPYPTLSQLLHNQTRPNSVCNLFSTQLEDSCKRTSLTTLRRATRVPTPLLDRVVSGPVARELRGKSVLCWKKFYEEVCRCGMISTASTAFSSPTSLKLYLESFFWAPECTNISEASDDE